MKLHAMTPAQIRAEIEKAKVAGNAQLVIDLTSALTMLLQIGQSFRASTNGRDSQ